MRRKVGPEIGISEKREEEIRQELEAYFSRNVDLSTVDILQFILSHPDFTTAERVFLAFTIGLQYEPKSREGT